MEFLENFGILLSRLLICSLYLWAGWSKVLDWKGTVAYMESKKFPLIPLMLPAAIIIQVLGALSLFFGFYCRLGALALIVFTIPAMIKMHGFWKETGAARLAEKIYFMKDVAILGGLILLAIFGPGNFSLDTFLKA